MPVQADLDAEQFAAVTAPIDKPLVIKAGYLLTFSHFFLFDSSLHTRIALSLLHVQLAYLLVSHRTWIGEDVRNCEQSHSYHQQHSKCNRYIMFDFFQECIN